MAPRRYPRRIPSRVPRTLLLCIFMGSTHPAYAADNSLSTILCGILQDLTPKVRTFRPEGAQAQFVMATAKAFNYEPAGLRRVQEEIDNVTTASCPQEREAMLAILKMPSLGEAVW
ncbi:MAG TPA: hypothetical protein VI542_25420 [Candidatus Tectomicrobia bacterium]